VQQDESRLLLAHQSPDGALSNITNPVEAAKLKIQRDARYAAVQTGIAPVMDEFATVMGGGQGTDSLRKTYETQLAAAKSPQEFNAILGTMAERMKGRVDTLEADRKRIMGPHAKGGELLSPEAQAGYGRLIAAKEKAYADSDARIRGTGPAAPQGQAPAAGQYTPDQLTAIQAEARKRGL
jgi:hypothetical protein